MPETSTENLSRNDGAAAVRLPSAAVPALHPVPAAAPDPAAGTRRYRRRVLSVLALVILALALYWASGYVLAYTNDAYVASDLVAVAPQVTGRIVAVPVTDNQTVKKGMLLAAIDPQPFRLALAGQQAKQAAAEAQLAVDHDRIKSLKAAREAAVARDRLADDNLRRAQPLATTGFLSREGLDQATAAQQEAAAALSDAGNAVLEERQMQALHEATVKAIGARIATLEWQLGQTRILAPTDGTITNLTLRVGDQAVADKPLIGIVDAHAWRVLANYKESVIRHMRIGGTAWVWLDTYPWRLYPAKIQGIARGISRAPAPGALLPYVEPTTDWIRLERRFPVTLVLGGLPKSVVLRMGSDARVVMFY